MKPAATPSLSSLWLHWVIANASAVGTVHALVVMAYEWADDNPKASSLLILAMIPGGLGLLFLVGYAQQMVLRQWIAFVDYWALMMPAKLLMGTVFSVGLSIVTFSLIWAIGDVTFGARRSQLGEIVMVSIGALWFGVGFGLLQLPYLCLTQRGGWLWLGASALGMTLGFFTQQLVWTVAFMRNNSGFSSIGGSAMMGTLAGAVYGAITGAALVVLMRGHPKYPVRIGGYGPQQRP